ncbi:putative Ig domain-containing protein [Lysobacter olei]
MTTPAWEPGTLYLPGALVVPRTAPPAQPVAIVNGDLEAGASAWNFGGDVVLDTGFRFEGTNSLRVNGTGDVTLLNTTEGPCAQGRVVNASCMYHQGAASAGDNTGRVLLQFLDASSVVLSTVLGNVITSSDGGWKKSSVAGTAPANTAKVKIGAFSHKTDSAEHQFDKFQWDLTANTEGLLYKAVQPEAGTSDDAEPAWPSTLGVTVVDNTVTWEAVAISRIVWEPQAAMVSGSTEPSWPTGMGTRVADGQIAWEAIPRRIEDENCPHSKVVTIASSKVYAADDDVVRYCATVNPYDWSTANDAGYLPYGLQQYGANPIAAMGLYRSNLVIFNAQAFQMWQVDEDPANSALLDALPIGSTWHKALAPVSNDLFFLSAQGVRTVSIAGGSTNLAAGDVGMPIDPLVQDAIRVAGANSTKALATYYPSAGQYWLAFAQYPAPTLALSGDHPDGEVGVNPGATQYTATGGVLPYGNYSLASGSLPPGRTLNASTGAVTGTPTLGGTYTWTVSITDADGTVATLDDSAAIATHAVFVSQAVTVGSVLHSEDATTYTTSVATGLAAGIGRMYAANGRVFVFPSSGTTGRVTADRGATWADVTGFSSLARNGMTYAEHGGTGRYLVFMGSGASAYSSTNGVAFSAMAVEDRGYYGAAAKGSIVVAMSTLASLIRSTDGGQTFSAAFSNGVGNVELCLATETYFFAAGANGLVLRSALGETWTSVLAVGNWQGLAYGQGRLMVLGSAGECRYSDDNGGTWTVGPTIAGFSTGGAGTQNLAYAQGLFIAVGSTQEIYTTPAVGTPVWTQRKNEANPPTYEDVVAVRYVP